MAKVRNTWQKSEIHKSQKYMAKVRNTKKSEIHAKSQKYMAKKSEIHG